MKNAIAVCICILILFGVAGCESILEQQREELILEACRAGVFIPPDLMPASRVINSFVGMDPAVSGHMVGPWQQAVVDDVYVSHVLSGRQSAGAYGYHPTDGIKVIIEDAFVDPEHVLAGNYVNLNIRYVLLSPVDHNWAEITEFRSIYLNSELVGKPESHLALPDGTFTTSVRLRLPKDAPLGEYEVLSQVQTANALDARKTSFSVVDVH